MFLHRAVPRYDGLALKPKDRLIPIYDKESGRIVDVRCVLQRKPIDLIYLCVPCWLDHEAATRSRWGDLRLHIEDRLVTYYKVELQLAARLRRVVFKTQQVRSLLLKQVRELSIDEAAHRVADGSRRVLELLRVFEARHGWRIRGYGRLPEERGRAQTSLERRDGKARWKRENQGTKLPLQLGLAKVEALVAAQHFQDGSGRQVPKRSGSDDAFPGQTGQLARHHRVPQSGINQLHQAVPEGRSIADIAKTIKPNSKNGFLSTQGGEPISFGSDGENRFHSKEVDG